MRTMFHRIARLYRSRVPARHRRRPGNGFSRRDPVLSDDEIENLCEVIRRHGGTIPGPNPNAAPVNNPGTPVSL